MEFRVLGNQGEEFGVLLAIFVRGKEEAPHIEHGELPRVGFHVAYHDRRDFPDDILDAGIMGIEGHTVDARLLGDIRHRDVGIRLLQRKPDESLLQGLAVLDESPVFRNPVHLLPSPNPLTGN